MSQAYFLGRRGGGLWSLFCLYWRCLGKKALNQVTLSDTHHIYYIFYNVPGVALGLSHASYNGIFLADLSDRCHLCCYTDKKSRAQRGQVICPRVPSYQGGGVRSGQPDLELRSRASCITCIVGPGPVAAALPRSLLGNAPAQPYQARVHNVPRSPGGLCARAGSRNPGPTTMPRVPLRLPAPHTYLPLRPALMPSHSLLWSHPPDLSRESR